MGIDQERHRPGLLKQQNKAHKHGRHRSKGAVGNADKGRVSVKQVTKKVKGIVSKDERRNQLVQNRLKKRQEALQKKRQLGGNKVPPFLVAVVPLAYDVETEKIIKLISGCATEADISKTTEGILHVRVQRLKQRFSFVVPQKGNIYSVLDSLKVADTVLFVVSALSEPFVDDVCKKVLTAVLAQGLPTTVVAAMELNNIPLKKRAACKQEMQKVVSQWLPDDKIMSLEKNGDEFNLLRKIGGQKQRRVSQRDHRPHLLAESVEFCSDGSSLTGTLKVSGYLRGQILSANSLVHIPGWGDYQMKQIDVWEDPQPLLAAKSEDATVSVLQVSDPSKQSSLVSENEPDLMDAEQTWPTKEELDAAKAEQKKKKVVKKIPKGMSEYQACWIPDDDVEELDDESEDDDEVGGKMDVASEENSDADESEEEEEYDTITMTEGDVDADKYDSAMDMDEEEKSKAKLKEAKEDRLFPDEVDTPQDIPARDRFQKYRGLASFRTSPWDPKENLPVEYARIFQFENFNRTRKRIYSELENEQVHGALPGMFITVHVSAVPHDLAQSRNKDQVIVLYGMLEHEQRMSVVNMVVRRCPHSLLSQSPVRSKEELVFQCGYRRYKGRPIFSQHTNGTKHKYERFFQPDSTTVATLFSPVIFPPASVLVLKEISNGTQDLVATGHVLSVNPDRLVIKRAVLSGHPLKVHKRSAVIRFMFFNREDIEWFKPVELRTKHGRRGHIKEPLGTHGHMKTVFDGQLKSQDTVLMYLYKRVFPKWSYNPITKFTPSMYKTLPTIKEEDEMEVGT